jgi:hypothetical protein
VTGGLAAAQRWFQDVVTDPDGVDAGLTHAADRLGGRDLDAVVNGTRALDARDRLALYSATYRRRLTGCLRESYPGLRHALGDELFHDFALDYLRARPSRSYTLASLGAGWSDHLEQTRPDHDLPQAAREAWPDFLVDLARLERTFCEVYDAPGIEDDVLPTSPAVDRLGEAGCAAARVTPVVCLRLLDVRYPVGRYLAAVRAGEAPPLPPPARTCLAVSRRDYVVTITELDLPGHRLLNELAAGRLLGDGAQTAGLGLPDAVALLRGWTDRGLIAALDVPGPAGRPTRSRGE